VLVRTWLSRAPTVWLNSSGDACKSPSQLSRQFSKNAHCTLGGGAGDLAVGIGGGFVHGRRLYCFTHFVCHIYTFQTHHIFAARMKSARLTVCLARAAKRSGATSSASGYWAAFATVSRTASFLPAAYSSSLDSYGGVTAKIPAPLVKMIRPVAGSHTAAVPS